MNLSTHIGLDLLPIDQVLSTHLLHLVLSTIEKNGEYCSLSIFGILHEDEIIVAMARKIVHLIHEQSKISVTLTCVIKIITWLIIQTDQVFLFKQKSFQYELLVSTAYLESQLNVGHGS